MEHLAVGYRWFQRCFMFNPDIGGLMIPTLTCANTTCNMGVEKSANLWSFEPGNLGKCPFTLSVDNPWFKRISRCWKYDGHRNAGVSNFQKNLNLFAVFCCLKRKMLANYLELRVFFLCFLYVPRNEQTKTPQNAIWRWYLLKANITSDRKRQHTKSPFLGETYINLWCFGRYQEIGETYACFQVARFPGFGVLTYRTFHGTMDELRVSMTNGLKVWFDGVASPFWIIIHSFVAQQVLALILVYRYLETIFIINHSIGPSVLIQLYIYTPYIIFSLWQLDEVSVVSQLIPKRHVFSLKG